MTLNDIMASPQPDDDCQNCAELHEKLEAAREILKAVHAVLCSELCGTKRHHEQCVRAEKALQKLGEEG